MPKIETTDRNAGEQPVVQKSSAAASRILRAVEKSRGDTAGRLQLPSPALEAAPAVAVATPEGAQARTLRLPGDRERVRTYATTAALHLTRLAITGEWWSR